jgi:hypothetical protein
MNLVGLPQIIVVAQTDINCAYQDFIKTRYFVKAYYVKTEFELFFQYLTLQNHGH